MTVVYKWYHDNVCFYVGIGESKYRATSRKGRNTHCSRKRAKAEKEKTFSIEIVADNLTREQACELECQLIQQIGRYDLGLGELTNKTKGGDGNSEPRTKIHKNRISKSHKGKPKSNKQKCRQRVEGVKQSKETIEKRKQSMKGKRSVARQVLTPLGKFSSVRQAARKHKISPGTMINRLNGWEGYNYL